MGDIAELRGLITVIAFFSCFVILVGAIPPEFLYASPDYRQVEPPEYFEAIDITAYAQTYNDTVPPPDPVPPYDSVDWSLGGYDWSLICVDSSPDFIQIGKREYWWIFQIGVTWFHFRNSEGIDRGEQLTSAELDSDYDEESETTKYSCSSPIWQNVQFDLYFGFNTTTYEAPSEALSGNELYFLQGMGIEAISTTINAWNLIGMLLFFQMPEVHPILNALIAIPIWVCIGYLIYVLILKAIPFVGD